MKTTVNLSEQVGTVSACHALGVARASLYRYSRRLDASPVRTQRPSPPRSLREAERQAVLEQLNSERDRKSVV